MQIGCIDLVQIVVAAPVNRNEKNGWPEIGNAVGSRRGDGEQANEKNCKSSPMSTHNGLKISSPIKHYPTTLDDYELSLRSVMYKCLSPAYSCVAAGALTWRITFA